MGAQVPRPIPWSPKAGHPLFSAPPLFPVDPTALADLRDQLRRWDAFAAATSETSTPIYRDLYPQTREYLLGWLSIRLGKSALARKHAQVLDTLSVTLATRGLARLSAAVLRADAARAEGRPAEALAFLEQASVEVPIELGGAFRGWTVQRMVARRTAPSA